MNTQKSVSPQFLLLQLRHLQKAVLIIEVKACISHKSHQLNVKTK